MKKSSHRPLFLTTMAALVVALAGCETTKLNDTTTGAPVETRSATAGTGTGGGAAAGAATATPAPQSSVATVDLASRGAAAAGAGSTLLSAERIVYFDFDSFAIKDDSKPVIDGHARVLSSNRGKRLVVEGHTDERGGREYNLALGQKRAAAVVRSLTLLDVRDNQLEAVSFGEERPAATGGEESAWSKNRRAELKDR